MSCVEIFSTQIAQMPQTNADYLKYRIREQSLKRNLRKSALNPRQGF